MTRAVLFLLFALLTGIAVANERAYTLGTGDLVSIQVFGEPELSLQIRLDDSGKIAYPLLGELPVAGLTLSGLEQMLLKRLKGPYLLDPKITVSIAEYRQFFINGEVSKPGGYAYIPGLTLRKAIALAGGMTEFASVDRITLIREGDAKKNEVFTKMETRVLAGDIITVKEYKKVFIHGEVKKPGSYSFHPELTVRKAIALAGGLTPRGSEDKVKRQQDEGVEKLVKTLDEKVTPGDLITVGERFF